MWGGEGCKGASSVAVGGVGVSEREVSAIIVS